jgi:hypothetical protein
MITPPDSWTKAIECAKGLMAGQHPYMVINMSSTLYLKVLFEEDPEGWLKEKQTSFRLGGDLTSFLGLGFCGQQYVRRGGRRPPQEFILPPGQVLKHDMQSSTILASAAFLLNPRDPQHKILANWFRRTVEAGSTITFSDLHSEDIMTTLAARSLLEAMHLHEHPELLNGDAPSATALLNSIERVGAGQVTELSVNQSQDLVFPEEILPDRR